MHSNHSSESKSPPVSHGSLAMKRKSNTPVNYHQPPQVNDMKKKRFEFIPQQPQPQQNHYQSSPHLQQYQVGVTHPHYSAYQSLPSSVAIHPIPAPTQPQPPPISVTRKDVSVVVSVANASLSNYMVGGDQKGMMTVSMEPGRGAKPLPVQVMNPHLPVVTNSITITPREEVPKQPAITITTATIPVPVNNKPIVSVVNNNSGNTNVNSPVPVTTTPVKLPVVEPTKAVSPVPRISSGGPRNLKKAWLQRHSGEDGAEEKTSGPVVDPVVTNGMNNGNGLVVKTVVPEVQVVQTSGSPIKPIGMAVNSVIGGGLVVNETTTSNGNKVPPQHPKKTAVLMSNNNSSESNNKGAKMQVDTDSDAKEDSSSSDQVCG